MESGRRRFRWKTTSTPSSASSSSLESSGGDCVAMAALADSGAIVFCRIGVDGAWTLLETDHPVGPVTSVVHLEGTKFLAISDGSRVNGPRGISICDVAAGAAPTVTRVQGLHGAPKLTCYARSYMHVKGELYVVATVWHGSTPRSHLYKCNVMAAKPRWTWVRDTDNALTFFMSTNLTDFTAGYGGAASVSGFKTNSVYCTKPSPCRRWVELEIIDIANGTSELVQPAGHNTMEGSGPLCWIQPNHWA